MLYSVNFRDGKRGREGTKRPMDDFLCEMEVLMIFMVLMTYDIFRQWGVL